MYLLSMSHTASIRDLIAILTGIGYQESYIRITLSQLKQQGVVVTPQRGTYQLTAQTQPYVTELEKKVVSINAATVTYTLFITGFRAQHAANRQQTANLLRRLGFGTLGNGVYVGIGDKRSARAALTLADQDTVKAVQTSQMTPEPTRTEIYQWWSLDQVAVQVAQLQQRATELLDQGELPALTNLTLLQRYLQLIDLVGAYYACDPMLPKRLVGADWPGYRLLRQLVTYGRQIVAQADVTAPYHQYFDFGVLTR